MSDFNKTVWAPWRMDYIRSLGEELEEDGCFLCRYHDEPARDRENHVLWRGESTFVVMNRFPYTTGHLLIALARHQGDIDDLDDGEVAEMSRSIHNGVGVLRAALSPQGFNIGYNIGQCAGAGLPDHLHAHLVPRWSGDTNFMSVVGDCRVIPDALDKLYAELVRHATEAGLRS